MCYGCRVTCDDCRPKFVNCPHCGWRCLLVFDRCARCGESISEEAKADAIDAWKASKEKGRRPVTGDKQKEGKSERNDS
jgi:hypothetical protein